MNRVFKTLWSRSRSEYVVAGETARAKGKKSRSVLALAVAATLVAVSGCSTQSYEDPGKSGDVASWETPEYQKDWGLKAMNASSAYAMGYTGKNVQLGVMDSGILTEHQEFKNGDRITVTSVKGEYGTDGNRYPQSVKSNEPGLPFKKGEAFETTGEFVQGLNDSHGTHCTGTIAAARDGVEMHGVAFDAKVVVGNTAANDDNNYGPYQDYAFFNAGWDALVKAGARVINNSWGTNIKLLADQDGRLYQPGEKYPEDAKRAQFGFAFLANQDDLNDYTGYTPKVAEYEYFYFQKKKRDLGVEKDLIDAAWDAVAGTETVQVFTSGNWRWKDAFYRPGSPYFRPELENNWLSVTAIKEEDGKYSIWDVNEGGQAKWWTIAAPGRNIYSAVADDSDKGKEKIGMPNPGYNNGKLGDDYGPKGGTSMAAPHVTGALGIILERYPDMTAQQARQVLLTTASHTNPDGSVLEGWTAAEGEVDVKYGWGMPDLKKAMFGPAQLLGEFRYDVKKGHTDTWENAISETALLQREAEETAWLKSVTRADGTVDQALGGDYVLGDRFIVADGNADDRDHIVTPEDAAKWRQAYYDLRAQAIRDKQAKNLYRGSLVKTGEGTLKLMGQNTFTGGIVIEAGKVIAMPEGLAEGKVVVKKGATLEILPSKMKIRPGYTLEVEDGATVTYLK